VEVVGARAWQVLVIFSPLLFIGAFGFAQAPSPPAAVGVVAAAPRPLTQTEQFLGRIEAKQRVDIVARVTGFLEKRLFTEGTEVKTGDKLYQLEKGPFEADLAAKQANVAQLQATLANAKLTTDRARTLLRGPAGTQATLDAAVANQQSLEAQVKGAEAQVKASEINLAYTDILAPIGGRIGRTSVTEGNVVGPTSGVMTTIVSQDPMYVTFPIPVREALMLRKRYADRGGFSAVQIRLNLPDGRLYGKTGNLNFANNTVTTNTDTITVRGEIENPVAIPATGTRGPSRELVDGEFVTVQLEGVQPVEVLAVPRAAVLADQQGSYVYVVGGDNSVEQRRIQLGQSTTTLASIISGLKEGDRVVVEGLQKVRPGAKVTPSPASPQIQALMTGDVTEGESKQGAPAEASPAPSAPAASPAPSAPAAGTSGTAPAKANQGKAKGTSSSNAKKR